jgi:hypothetical protein
MTRGKLGVLIAAALCFAVCAVQSDELFSQNKELTAAELVAKHIRALGKSEALAKVKTRGVFGDAAVQFIQGGTGALMDGQFALGSEGRNLGMTLKFKDNQYPGEYFAYNGKETSVGHITPGQKSPIGDFVFRYNAIMKEGLLGGTMSVAWPLLSLNDKPVDLECKQEKIKDHNYYVLEYGSRKNLGDNLKVKLYFDPETFLHVRTEYRVRIKNDASALPSVNSGGIGSSTSGLAQNDTNRRRPDERAARETIQTSQADSIYTMVELFSNFSAVDGVVLPKDYSIDYSAEGSGVSFIARWAVLVKFWKPNMPIVPEFFVAQK